MPYLRDRLGPFVVDSSRPWPQPWRGASIQPCPNGVDLQQGPSRRSSVAQVSKLWERGTAFQWPWYGSFVLVQVTIRVLLNVSPILGTAI